MEIRNESVSEELKDDIGGSVTAISDKNIESYIIKIEEVVRIQGTELGRAWPSARGSRKRESNWPQLFRHRRPLILPPIPFR